MFLLNGQFYDKFQIIKALNMVKISKVTKKEPVHYCTDSVFKKSKFP